MTCITTGEIFGRAVDKKVSKRLPLLSAGRDDESFEPFLLLRVGDPR